MLTHLDSKNRPKMVDVSPKGETLRKATASGIIKMSKEAFEAIKKKLSQKRSCFTNCSSCSDNGCKKNKRAYPNVPSFAN